MKKTIETMCVAITEAYRESTNLRAEKSIFKVTVAGTDSDAMFSMTVQDKGGLKVGSIYNLTLEEIPPCPAK